MPNFDQLNGQGVYSPAARSRNASANAAQGPMDWESYGLDTFADNGDKAAAVLADAAKQLGVSPNDPGFQQAAKQADVAGKVGWGGPSPDQIVGLVRRNYRGAVASPDAQAGRDKSAAADQYANYQDALTGDPNNPLIKSIAASNPYAAGSPILQALTNQTMNTGERQAHDLLGSLFGGGATSGEVNAAKNNLAASTNTNLQNLSLLAPEYQQQQLGAYGNSIGAAANTALGFNSLAQGGQQFNQRLAQDNAAASNANNAALGGLATKVGATGLAALGTAIPGPWTPAMPFVDTAVAGMWGAK